MRSRGGAEARGGRAVSDVELVVVEDEQDACRRRRRAARTGRARRRERRPHGRQTPERAYEEAAKREGDWSKVDLWWGDERCVPPDHEESNYGLAKSSLLDRLERAPHARPPDQGRAREGGGRRALRAELDDTRSTCCSSAWAPTATSRRSSRMRRHSPARRALPAEAGLEPFVDRVTLSLPTLAQRARDPLPHRGRVESRRGGPCLRRRAEPRHARQPRPRDATAGRLQSWIALLQPGFPLDRASLYVEVNPGLACRKRSYSTSPSS